MDEERDRRAMATSPQGRPSDASIAQLRDEVGARTAEQRERTIVDLTLVDALLSVGADQDAARVIEEYQAVLRAYAAGLEKAVADAAAQREAEWIVQGAQRSAPDSEPSSAGAPGGRPGLRTRLATSVAAVALALGLGGAMASLETGAADRVVRADPTFVHAELIAARERLAALLGEDAAAPRVAREARHLNERILSLPDHVLARDDVKGEIVGVLALQEQLLDRRGDEGPQSRLLRDEIVALRVSLNLPSSPRPATAPHAPPAATDDVGAVEVQAPEGAEVPLDRVQERRWVDAPPAAAEEAEATEDDAASGEDADGDHLMHEANEGFGGAD